MCQLSTRNKYYQQKVVSINTLTFISCEQLAHSEPLDVKHEYDSKSILKIFVRITYFKIPFNSLN